MTNKVAAAKLAAMLAPIDWGDVAASEVQGPENPNKPKRREE